MNPKFLYSSTHQAGKIEETDDDNTVIYSSYIKDILNDLMIYTVDNENIKVKEVYHE